MKLKRADDDKTSMTTAATFWSLSSGFMVASSNRARLSIEQDTHTHTHIRILLIFIWHCIANNRTVKEADEICFKSNSINGCILNTCISGSTHSISLNAWQGKPFVFYSIFRTSSKWSWTLKCTLRGSRRRWPGVRWVWPTRSRFTSTFWRWAEH